MEDDFYQVEILHYLNPHLIWVEVKNAEKKEFVFEQVGIYGILPMEPVWDADGTVGTQKCYKWVPAATIVMKNLLSEAEQVWFLPTYIDRRSSIFDNNVHKFGNIKIIKANGKSKDLAHQLVKSTFAFEDITSFHQELASGTLKTKLDRSQTKYIMKQIELHYKQENRANNWEQSVKTQMSVYHRSQKFESKLTEQNLKRHERDELLLERKLRDFERCKDIDEVSVGRGISRNKRNLDDPSKKVTSQNSAVITPIELNNDLGIMIDATKKFIDINSEMKDTDVSNDVEKFVSHAGSFQKSTSINEDICKESKKTSYHKELPNLETPVKTGTKHTRAKVLKKDSFVAYGPSGVSPTNLVIKRCDSYKQKKLDSVDTPRNDNLDSDSHIFESMVNLDLVKAENKILLNDDNFNHHKSARSVSNKNVDKFNENVNNSNIPQTNKSSINNLKNIDSKIVKQNTIKSVALHNNEFEIVSGRVDTSSKDNQNAAAAENRPKVSGLLQKKLRLHREFKKNESSSDTSKSFEVEKQIHKDSDGENIEEIVKRLDGRVDTSSKDNQSAAAADSRPKVSGLLQKKLRLQREIKNNESSSDTSKSFEVEKQIHKDSVDENIEEIVKRLDGRVDTSSKDNQSAAAADNRPKVSGLLQKKLRLQREIKNNESSSDTSKSFEVEKKIHKDSDDENIEEIVKRLDLKTTPKVQNVNNNKVTKVGVEEVKIDVNPFKNLDGSQSIFVEKLISPMLLVHTKKNNCIRPCNSIRDVPFGTNIQIVLHNMGVKQLTRLQSVSWYTILRGYSTFLISPRGSGKTMGYLPAVCRLVADSIEDTCAGPICIVVCATAKSVADVEKHAKMFFGLKEKVLACYSGMDELNLTTSLLNGCDLLITTPSLLVRLLQAEFGIDLQRITTLVLEDCERLTDVYIDEIQFLFYKIKEMLKSRVNKDLKVQVVAVSRQWSKYLEKLAKKAPDSVVCFGAFQECVLYSKVNTSVDFIKKDAKIDAVVKFLKDADTTKRKVIVCRNDDEVKVLEKVLIKAKYVIFSCNSTMTVQDLFSINIAWADYKEPILGPILICCDDNINHLNITNAHYLIHYSLPPLYSMFCRRFAVLIDNYPSIFKENKENVKIKILLEENNIEQLPKILSFCKRCTDNVHEVLDQIAKKVLLKKDLVKAQEYLPLCDNLLALGECPDFWNCVERHSIFEDYDRPVKWMPTKGLITFKVLFYHTPALLSARLLTNTVQNQTIKYTQGYNKLALKMGMYYSQENNKKLHGIPKLGDICAVALKQSFYERCQILKILNHYPNGNPKYVLIKLIDEEIYEKVKDIYLYYLPDELKNIETHTIRVRLANIQPKDKDITYPDLAINELKSKTDKDDSLFLRGKVTLTIGNNVFVDTLEACDMLTSLNETVVKHDFKQELLNKYAIPKTDHISILENLCTAVNLISNKSDIIVMPKQALPKLEGRWAYLEPGVFSEVYFASAESPSKFFVRLIKFEKCMKELLKDMQKYIEDNPNPLAEVEKGDIVIAEFPDDKTYERARVEEIYNEKEVKCFFLDQGDWRSVQTKKLFKMTQKFVDKIPFQAIECSLIGIEPVGDSWTEFSTNWFCDNCCDTNGSIKTLYVKYFAKGKAELTNAHRYSVVIIDTYGERDIVINQLMMLLNLAKANDDFKYLDYVISNEASDLDSPHSFVIVDEIEKDSQRNITGDLKSSPNDGVSDKQSTSSSSSFENDVAKGQVEKSSSRGLIRSMPLVTDDPIFDPDRWDVYNPNEIVKLNGVDIKSNVESSSNNAALTEYNKCDTDNKAMKLINKDTKVGNEVFKANVNDIPFKNSKSYVSLDSDDLSSLGTDVDKDVTNKENHEDFYQRESIIKVEDEKRKPKLYWHQNKTTVYIKILLIAVEAYSLTIKDSSIYFSSHHNDSMYSFNFDLYGGVRKEKSSHSNKGQYILVTLPKILQRNWLTLTKDGGIRKWIVYDVDAIDTSSDEEEIDSSNLEVIKRIHEDKESDSDEDEAFDDTKFIFR